MGRRELDTRDRRNQGYGKVVLISFNSYNIAKSMQVILMTNNNIFAL